MKRPYRNVLVGLSGVLLVAVLVAATSKFGDRPDIGAAEEKPVAKVSDDKSALPSDAALEKLAKDDPLAFLEACIRRCQREVKGYTVTLDKQEWVGRKMGPHEIVEVSFKDKPHSVFMQWLEGAGRAERVLFVEDDDGAVMLARPRSALARGFAGDIVKQEPSGPDGARLKRFGFKKSMERMLATWNEAKDKEGSLPVKYLGEAKLKELGDRPCYQFRFTPATAQDKGVTDITMWVDKDLWLLTGTVMRNADGKLVGEYYFRDVKLNPEFKEEQFKREALKP